MGFLADCGQTLDYFESKPLITYIKKHGIIQFLHLYKKYKDSSKSQVFWGDEIEFHLVNMDPKAKLAKLQTNTDYIFNSLKSEDFNVQPEFGAWMIETVPNDPYKFDGSPLQIYKNMEIRRKKVQEMCNEGDILFAGTAFPLLGVGDYFIPKIEFGQHLKRDGEQEVLNYKKRNPFSNSQFIHDEIISYHPRFPTCVGNIRQRRGEKVKILAPIYQDENTSFEVTKDEPYPGSIYMDALHFGMGSGCLQVTFGAENVEEARYLTDQLAILSSIMLPMTAATAIFKGKLADVDVRWNVLSSSVDCRNSEERDPKNPKHIAKSRYSSISQYISDRPQCKEEYNDIDCPMNEEFMRFAAEQAQVLGVDLDERLLRHLGFLFARDPLVVFPDKIYVDDTSNNNHFENLQSTNWNSVRFKPPPSFNSDIGWRVELRTPENQLTSEENVACAMFSYFMVAMIKKKEYNLYIPISKVDENIERGHRRDAVLKEKFWFRKNIQKESADEWVELTLDEILHGKADVFVGLINLIYDFCKEEYGVNLREWKEREPEDEETKTDDTIMENMKFFSILSKRVKGEMPTIAAWARNFVLNHPKYQKDSIVSPEIGYDLVCAMMKISNHEKKYEDYM